MVETYYSCLSAKPLFFNEHMKQKINCKIVPLIQGNTYSYIIITSYPLSDYNSLPSHFVQAHSVRWSDGGRTVHVGVLNLYI